MGGQVQVAQLVLNFISVVFMGMMLYILNDLRSRIFRVENALISNGITHDGCRKGPRATA